MIPLIGGGGGWVGGVDREYNGHTAPNKEWLPFIDTAKKQKTSFLP